MKVYARKVVYFENNDYRFYVFSIILLTCKTKYVDSSDQYISTMCLILSIHCFDDSLLVYVQLLIVVFFL